MVQLRLASNIQRICALARLASVQALPPNNRHKNLVAIDLSQAVTRGGTSAAGNALEALNSGAELVLGLGAARDGEALDELGIDNLLGGVWLELDEVDSGGAGHDGLELAHDFLEGGGGLEFGLGCGVFPACGVLVKIWGWGKERRTDEELEVVLILALGAPAGADVAILDFKGLEEELDWFSPCLDTTSGWEDESLSDSHFEFFWLVN